MGQYEPWTGMQDTGCTSLCQKHCGLTKCFEECVAKKCIDPGSSYHQGWIG